MGDFLSSLLARSQPAPLASVPPGEGEAVILQPRLPSLFESTSRADGLPAPQADPVERESGPGISGLHAESIIPANPAAGAPGLETAALGSSPIAAPRREEAGPRRETPIAARPAPAAPEPPSEPERRARPASPPRPAPARQAPARIELAGPPAADSAGRSTDREPAHAGQDAALFPRLSEPRRTAAPHRAAGTLPLPAPLALPVDSPQKPGERESPRDAIPPVGLPPGEGPVRRRAASIAHAPQASELRPRLQPADPFPQTSAPAVSSGSGPAAARPTSSSPHSEPTETVVQVHIGRIEVRAVQAPAPVAPASARPQPAGPKMSLEEYLRQREGRR
jgi:hypothetical protein